MSRCPFLKTCLSGDTCTVINSMVEEERIKMANYFGFDWHYRKKYCISGRPVDHDYKECVFYTYKIEQPVWSVS